MRCYYFLVALSVTLFTFSVTQGQPDHRKPTVGVCVTDDQMIQAQEAGFDFIVPSVASYLKPNLTDEEFRAIEINKISSPVFACNSFFPSHMKCVGPNADLTSLLEYAEIVFKRAKQVGAPIIVFGSGGARTIPDGFSKAQAINQFIELCAELAKLAEQYEMKIALENLNKGETNFINTVEEAIAICKQVNMPNFGINVDIYHMLRENEPANNILKAQNHVLICDIAEPENRTPPGVEGTNFGDYLKALRQIDYYGGIAIEARWGDFTEQSSTAYETLIEQLNAIY